MKLLGIVVCFLCVNFLVASETYKAGVLLNKEINEFTPLVHQAKQMGVDILALPSLPSGSADKYDEVSF
uniref:CN hydrolase domain-containing protein n=1 Tax=Heliothis virescens TaxID=7102 RepID=A0A2A4J8Y7_HELVI